MNQIHSKKKLFGIDLINFGKNNKLKSKKKNREKGGLEATIGKAYRRKMNRMHGKYLFKETIDLGDYNSQIIRLRKEKKNRHSKRFHISNN